MTLDGKSQGLITACAQINPKVGDLSGNAEKIRVAAQRAQQAGAGLLITPEMSLIGYPAEDWLLRDAFCDAADKALDALALELGRCAPDVCVVVGTVTLCNGRRRNTLVLLEQGKRVGTYAKRHLPEYGVFDETRVFEPGESVLVHSVRGMRLAFCICEDLWYEEIAAECAAAGAQLLVSINASPYSFNKRSERESQVCSHAAAAHLPLIYVNQVGGQDELVFDGESFAADATGRIVRRMPGFVEAWDAFDVATLLTHAAPTVPPDLTGHDALLSALLMAIRDYVKKNGFEDVTLGLSGGVDSALVAALAAEALGPQHVWAVMLPTRFTADASTELSEQLVRNLGIHYQVKPIEPLFGAFQAALKDDFAGLGWSEAEENLQARIRGILLMAHSNKFSRLVLTTGNKSESAVGYSTLYGDTAGAFAPIRDVLKTDVWELCRRINTRAGFECIPNKIIERAPSAELRENQFDQEKLPDYVVLDAIVRGYVELGLDVGALVSQGLGRETVTRIVALIHQNEYKRRQCPVGPKISEVAFGKDWRYPITCRVRVS